MIRLGRVRPVVRMDRQCGFHHCDMPIRFVQADNEAPGVGRWTHVDSRFNYSAATGRGHAAMVKVSK